AVTQQVSAFVGKKLNVHGHLQRKSSGQLPFLGLTFMPVGVGTRGNRSFSLLERGFGVLAGLAVLRFGGKPGYFFSAKPKNFGQG
ncbi:MAG: hypothetical protein ORN28_10965, partial [Rhodoferax sp.]|nr:hypothetical protein [Rhodoferax sp.]